MNDYGVSPIQQRCTGGMMILTRQQRCDEHRRVAQSSHRRPSLPIRFSLSDLMAATIFSAEGGITPAGNKSVPSGDSSVINGTSSAYSASNSMRPGVTSTFISTPGCMPNTRRMGAGNKSRPELSKVSVAVMLLILPFKVSNCKRLSHPLGPDCAGNLGFWGGEVIWRLI